MHGGPILIDQRPLSPFPFASPYLLSLFGPLAGWTSRGSRMTVASVRRQPAVQAVGFLCALFGKGERPEGVVSAESQRRGKGQRQRSVSLPPVLARA